MAIYECLRPGVISSRTFCASFTSPWVCRDLQKSTPCNVYKQLVFNVPIGTRGNCYDRYSNRIKEMRQSFQIIMQCLNEMPSGMTKANDHKLCPPSGSQIKQSHI